MAGNYVLVKNHLDLEMSGGGLRLVCCNERVLIVVARRNTLNQSCVHFGKCLVVEVVVCKRIFSCIIGRKF